MVKYYRRRRYDGFGLTRESSSIPTVVASVIARDLALYECFKRRLVNYHAVAASIKPEVEKLAGRPTTINTIVVAITRLSTGEVRSSDEKPVSVLKDARIALASDVVNVTISARKSELYEVAKRIGALSSSLSEPTRMFQLSSSIELVADEREYESLIKSSLEPFEISRETAKLSRLDIHLSPAVQLNPGFGLFLSELLYRHGISIRQTYIGEETVLILKRSDGPLAFEVLQDEIDASRTTSSKSKDRPKSLRVNRGGVQ
jgi:hypothetical protein